MKKETAQKIDLASLLRSFATHIAIMTALYTYTYIKTTFSVLKISPVTANRSPTLAVASTGNVHQIQDRQHEKTCDGKVNYQYPGCAYHVPKTVFEELEEERNIVPEKGRYFSYRAIFGFECYFDKEGAQQLISTDKWNWQSCRVPLNVSVCSNVPGYQEPRFFVSEGEPYQMQFVKHLIKISIKKSFLLRQQHASVFQAQKSSEIVPLFKLIKAWVNIHFLRKSEGVVCLLRPCQNNI